MQEQKARRQAYYTCATDLLARQDAASALLHTFTEDTFDKAKAQVLLQKLDDHRDAVARAVGAAAAEGPYAVASNAEFAAAALEHLAGRLRDWVTSVTSGEDSNEMVQNQERYKRQDQDEIRQEVDHFTKECRKVLHPAKAADCGSPGDGG